MPTSTQKDAVARILLILKPSTANRLLAHIEGLRTLQISRKRQRNATPEEIIKAKEIYRRSGATAADLYIKEATRLETPAWCKGNYPVSMTSLVEYLLELGLEQFEEKMAGDYKNLTAPLPETWVEEHARIKAQRVQEFVHTLPITAKTKEVRRGNSNRK